MVKVAPRVGVRASGTVCASGYEGRHAPQGCSTSRLGNSRHQAPATLRHTDPNVSPTRQAQRRALTPRKSALRCTPGRWATWHSDEEVPQAQPQRPRPRQPPARRALRGDPQLLPRTPPGPHPARRSHQAALGCRGAHETPAQPRAVDNSQSGPSTRPASPRPRSPRGPSALVSGRGRK